MNPTKINYRSFSSMIRWENNVLHSNFPSILPQVAKAPRFTEFMINSFRHLGDKVAIVEGVSGEKRTFRDLETDVNAIAHGLQTKYGVGKRDMVGLLMPNHVDYFSAVHGIAKLGGIATPMNPAYTSHEIEKQLVISGAKAVIAHQNCMEQVIKARDAIFKSTDKHIEIIDIDYDVAQMRSIKDAKMPDTPAEEMDTVLVPFSSGTTGLPKGVELTHRNMVANVLQGYDVEHKFIPPDNVIISPLPMFHIYGFLGSIHNTLYEGATLITMQKYELEKFCSLVEKYKCTRMHVVPPILLQLSKSPIVDKYSFETMMMANSAAAPLSAATETEVSARLQTRVKQLWGMSEISPFGCGTPDDQLRSNTGTSGVPIADTSFKIIDLQTGETLPPGQEGELLVTGPQLMKGYLNEPEKTRECMSGEWFHTGDIARIEEDGFIYITDRLKELIKVKGFQVAPAELESVLLTHPHVQDSCVIPVDCEKSGQRPLAYVVLKPNNPAIAELDLVNFVEEKVAHYKRLTGGVIFVDSIPKTASGKILRRVVLDAHRAKSKR